MKCIIKDCYRNGIELFKNEPMCEFHWEKLTRMEIKMMSIKQNIKKYVNMGYTRKDAVIKALSEMKKYQRKDNEKK